MDIVSIVVGLALVVPSFLIWTLIHEGSHYLMGRAFRETFSVSFKLYPHNDPEYGFLWAAVRWDYFGTDYTGPEDALIALAPRAANVVAVLLTPLAALFESDAARVAWIVLVGGGLVDLAVGSIGSSPHSDLQRVVAGAGASPWALRCLGWGAAILSAALTGVALS
jgi:hypothetical protein